MIATAFVTGSGAHGLNLDRWFDDHAAGGHSIKLLTDGKLLTSERLALVSNAHQSIYISAYAFKADTTAMAFEQLLCDKAKAGLDVRLYLDHRGSEPFLPKADQLRSCGARVLIFDPMDDFGVAYFRETLHEKLLIVDGLSVIMGGSGYSDTYLNGSFDSPKWHDLDERIDGPAACWYHERFVSGWTETANRLIQSQLKVYMTTPPRRNLYATPEGLAHLDQLYGLARFRPCQYVSAGEARVYPLEQNPMYEDGHWLLKTHIQAIHASHHTIRLYSPYFIPHDSLVKALLDARSRNVDVTILTNSPVSSDEKETMPAMFRMTETLAKAGVKIYLWGKTSMLHRKGGVFDDHWTFFGSDNLDIGATDYNAESIAYTDDANTVRALNAELDADLGASSLMDRGTFLSTIPPLPFKKRFESRFLSHYF